MRIPERLQRTLRDRGVAAGVVGLLIVVAAAAAISLLGPGPSSTLLPAEPSAQATGMSEIYVHVVGAVVEPGVVTVPVGSRVFDAIAAAGGTTPDADPNALNLARDLHTGEQVVVPVRGAAPAIPPTAGAGLININTADEHALETLPHVGPALAQRIINYRTEHGGFQSVDELAKVSGIGSKRFADIAPLVTV